MSVDFDSFGGGGGAGVVGGQHGLYAAATNPQDAFQRLIASTSGFHQNSSAAAAARSAYPGLAYATAVQHDFKPTMNTQTR